MVQTIIKMKKIIISAIVLVTMTLACKKENSETVSTETAFQKNQRILTQSSWRLDSLYIKNDGTLVNNGIPDSCLLDDIYNFNKQGFYITQNGINLCFEDGMPVDSMNWEQTPKGDSLIFKAISLPFSIGYKINLVTDNKLVISNKDGFTEEIKVYKK